MKKANEICNVYIGSFILLYIFVAESISSILSKIYLIPLLSFSFLAYLKYISHSLHLMMMMMILVYNIRIWKMIIYVYIKVCLLLSIEVRNNNTNLPRRILKQMMKNIERKQEEEEKEAI